MSEIEFIKNKEVGMLICKIGQERCNRALDCNAAIIDRCDKCDHSKPHEFLRECRSNCIIGERTLCVEI